MRGKEATVTDVPVEQVRAQILQVLQAWGMAPDLAATTAELMAGTDLLGVDSHGISMLPAYEDKWRAGTLRLALTAITNEEVSGTSARELTDDEVLKVLAKEAKKRKEAATAYTDANRPELAAKEEAEYAVLETYLPAQLSDAELEQIVAAAVQETGATGMPQMGQVMKVAQARVAGRADGGRVAAVVKSTLAGR